MTNKRNIPDFNSMSDREFNQFEVEEMKRIFKIDPVEKYPDSYCIGYLKREKYNLDAMDKDSINKIICDTRIILALKFVGKTVQKKIRDLVKEEKKQRTN